MRPNRLLWTLFALYLTFIGGASYYNTIFAVKVAHHVVLTIIMALWLVQRLPTNKGLPVTGLRLPLTGFVLVVGVNIAFSLDPRMSFEHVWFLVVHLVLFLMLVDLIQRGYQRLVMELVFFMATLAVLISMWELVSWYIGTGIIPGTEVGFINIGQGLIPPLNLLPRLFLAMSVSTLLAGYIAPLVTVTLGWAVTTTQRDFRVVLFGLMALLSLVLLMTGSRGGLLGVGIALGAFALCQAIRSPRITAIIAPKVLIGIGVAGLIAASLGFVVLTLPRALGSSNEGRVDMWRSAVEMTADHPVFGVGYGMFGRAFREYRDPTIVQDKLAHAHNLYLNTLSELGVVGTAIVIWLAGTAITRIWRNYRAQIDRRRQMRLEAACCALLGFGAHSLVESFSITPIIFMVLSLLAYVMTPLPESRVVTPPKETRLYTAILLVIVLVWGVGMLIFDSAQNSYMQAFRRQTASEALADVAAAKASDPSLRLYDLVTAFLVDQNTTQPTDAIWVYESVLQLEPTWEIGWANLAALYATNDQPQAAFEAIQRAYALNNSTPALVWWARYADLTKGAPDDKIVKNYVRAMSNAYVLNRVLPVSSFWQETPLSQQALEEFAANVPLDWQYRIWQAQNPSRIAALIPTTPQTSAEWWIVGQEALNTGNATEALTAFETALALLPDNSQRGDYEASRAEALIATNAPQTDIELAIRRAKFYGLWLEEIPTVEGVEEDDAPRSTSINAIEFAAVLYGRPPLFDYSEALDYPDR